MDPGIPNAPITTLAGVASLTDCKAALPAEYSIQKVVPELPLPLPAPQAISNKSLLFHPRVEEEAKNLLRTKDAKLIPQLVSSLEKTSAEHIEVKDNYSDKNLNKDGIPNLLKALLEANQQVFSGNKALLLQQQQRILQQKQYQQQQLLRQQQQATQVSQTSESHQQLPNQHVIGQQQSLLSQSAVNQNQQSSSQQAQGIYQQSQQLNQQSHHLPNQQISTNQPNLQSQQQQQQLPNQQLIQQHQVQATQQQQQQLQVQQQQLKNQLLASQQQVSSPQYTSQQQISSPQYTSQPVQLSNQQSHPHPTQQQQTPLLASQQLQPAQQQQLPTSQQQQLQASQEQQLQASQQQQLQAPQQQQLPVSQQQQLQAPQQQQISVSQQQQLQASKQQQLQVLQQQQLQAAQQQQLQTAQQQQLQASQQQQLQPSQQFHSLQQQQLQASQQQTLQTAQQQQLQATTQQNLQTQHLTSQPQTPVIQPVAQDVRVIQETPQNQVRIQPAENPALPTVDKMQSTTPVDPKLSSPTPVQTDLNTPLQTKPVATSVIQHSDSSTANVNSNIVIKQPEVLQTNNHQKVDQPTPTPPVAHSKISELRMMRRPSNRGQQQATQNSTTITTTPSSTTPSSTALSSTTLSTNAIPVNNVLSKPPQPNSTENPTPKDSNITQRIKQPIIRIGRISEADQALLQKSLKEFVATKPQLAKQLGIDLNKKANYKEDSASEDESGSGRKRKKGSDDEYEPEDPMDTFSALMGKRRKLEEKGKEKPIVLAKPKLRKVEKKFVANKQKLSSEELMESNTYVRFNKSVQHVLRSANDMDFAEIVTEEVIQDEYLLGRSVMHELCTEAAKLKTLGAMEMFPTEKFTRLLHVLELNIRGGDKISPVAADDDNESIRDYCMESTMERVLGAADACLVCLYVMTSPNMNKRVYIEEVIDRIVLYIKYHLSNTIFPSYDSTYRLDNKKKDGRKKQKTVSQKGITQLYTKISEAVNLLAELMNIQVLTDTSVLHASSMGIAPFFVENISELQLASLKLVTTIFTKYENHRRLLLDDILASIARLPSTKRSLRTYRLNHEENIQMLTALVLQLIQCVVALPEKWAVNPKQPRKKEKDKEKETESLVEKDILICNKIEKATQIAGTFLKVFLSKCGSKQEEIDYRPLFENFIQDLLSTVNKPEWPATELLLSILGKMLVQNFSNKSTEMSLRLASLDYLGVVAARLRRDSVLSRCKVNTIDQMIKDIKQEESRHKEESDNRKKKSAVKTDDERTQFLQKMLLDFLGVNSQNDESYKNARHFYICQWYKNLVQEKAQIISDAKKKVNSTKKKYSDDDEDGNSDDEKSRNPEQENQEKFRQLEEKKKILISRIVAFQEATSSGGRVQVFQTYIDYDSAELIAQFLSSKRYFSQSFDQYLRAILVVLKETSIAIRTKAMKCLTMIVEADPSVLGRPDMQMGVNQSILDSSTSVREAAVDLVGKFILRRPELIHKYYQILSPRILDTGVSVRKRVIKILKDICIECPEFPKVPEICVKMIRRINDEEGIRKLVTEVFQNMWFTPTKEDQTLLRKVMHITDVVASSKEIGLEWFEQLLVSLYRPKEDKEDSTKVVTEPPKALVTACRQIVDCLIENILRLEEANAGGSNRLVACVTTLLSFTKIRPQLLIKHASTLQPYLALKCRTEGDKKIVSNVAAMLELVVPLLEHPSDTFLAQLEEDAMKLILSNDRPVVASCLACLGSIINKVTHNFQLIRDLFKKFNHVIVRAKNNMEMCNILNQSRENIPRDKGFFKRALFVVGLLLRHFDFRNPDVLGDLPLDTKDQVYLNLMFFLNQEEQETQVFTLKALGSICIRHYEFMLEPELKAFYHRQLTMIDAPLGMKTEVLVNIENYLVEEEKRMIQQDLEWKARSKHENLKEMNDVSSGMASTVIQLYLKEIMQSYLHQSLQVRQPALRVIQLIYSQGLVHPVKTVPYLICMSTDPEKAISHSADKTMADIEKKYPGFIHTQAGLGIRLSYELQRIIQNDEIVRGSSVKEPGEYPSALNGYLYSLLRNSRQQRRALILKVMKHFDEQARTSLSYMLYLADDLAYFPYQVQDEPLFIVHHIDLMISNTGTNLLQSFREGLISDNQNKILDAENGEVNNVISALDEEDDEDALAARVPEDASHLQACLTAAQGCLLLLVLKQHIKDVYGLSDGKIQLYSPSEPAKVFEKVINRRSNALFNPKSTIAKIKEGQPSEFLDENGRRDLIRQYLDFKQLMLQLDPEENEDDENKANQLVNLNQTGTATILTEADQVILQNYKDHTPPKVPKLVISHSRFTSDIKPKTPRSHRTTEKAKKVKHKKKRRKITSDSESDENDYSDPDWT